jgi:hypothetical protein
MGRNLLGLNSDPILRISTYLYPVQIRRVGTARLAAGPWTQFPGGLGKFSGSFMTHQPSISVIQVYMSFLPVFAHGR